MKKIDLSLKKSEIIDLYCNKQYSISKLSKMYSVSSAVISNFLKSENITVINRQNVVKYNLETDIIPLYLKGYSLTKLSKIFKADRNSLSKKLKESGIIVENKQNKTKFNENIFDSIDTEEKAYWLGFIFADGYISKSNYRFEISLKGDDKEHLDKFNIFMQHDDPNLVKLQIVTLNNKTYSKCRWSVTNKHLWTVLNSYGCVPRKSLILNFPDMSIFKSEDLIRHFIRGYFDGDGCFTQIMRKTKGLRPVLSFLGTNSFLNELSKILKLKNFDISNLIYHPEKPSTYELDIHIKSVYDFLDYLYKNSKIYLLRKYKKYCYFNNCRLYE